MLDCANRELLKGDVIIPDFVVNVSQILLYSNTSVTSLTVPENVKIIEFAACDAAVKLERVALPSTITLISSFAFYNTVNLQDFTIKAVNPPTLGRDVFRDSKCRVIKVPASAVETYKAAPGWKDLTIQAIE